MALAALAARTAPSRLAVRVGERARSGAGARRTAARAQLRSGVGGVAWEQSDLEVKLSVPLEEGVSTKGLRCLFTPTSLSVTTQQDEQLLEGELAGHRCVAGHCFWQLEEDAEGGRVLEVYLEKETPGEQWRALLQLADGEREQQEPDTTPTERCFLDLQLGDAPAVQRVEVELFGRCCPRTAENFVLLCERGEGEGFKGAPFHRVIPKFVAQGGDFTARDGTGGRAALEGIGGGPNFEDEAEGLRLVHDQPGLLSMANAGPDSNGSQFFFTFRAQPHLDGKHVIFGRVARGLDVLKSLEALGTPTGVPSQPITIADCGRLPPPAD